MTSRRTIGSALVLLACCLATMASTASATIPAPPGGPILVVTPGSSDEFRNYVPEIMRGEGLNDFAAASINSLSPALLSSYDVVVLSRTPLSDAQAAMLSDWVNAGGNLIALRPDTRLAGLLGISPVGGATSDDANLTVDTSRAPGAGITSTPLQYHGPADRYALAGATSVANLSSGGPAVTLRSVGAGHAAAFTYDLSRSVVETRQGNPAWATQERDHDSPTHPVVRSDDMFFGNADSGLPWLDLSRATVPSADEQQRLLANLITETARTPIPRFWYLPNGYKAALVLTGDDHGRGGTGGTAQRFQENLAASPPNCSVIEWQCVRSTSYIYPEVAQAGLGATAAQGYENQGFEIALHLKINGPDDCSPFTSGGTSDLNSNYVDQLKALRDALGASLPADTTRTHCIVWSDFDSQPITEAANGIRLDTNYYYWPGSWVGQKPGLLTGSGFPQRFAALNGSLIDVYQATTELNDELTDTASDIPTETDFANALLDNAVGPNGYYGVFTANNHNDPEKGANHAATIVAAAQAHGAPVITAKQLLTWLDGRNASAFQGVAFNGGQLTFNIAQAAGAHGLQAMIPINGSTGALQGLSRNGAPVATSTRTVKGIAYAVFDAQSGSYVATYPAPGAGGGTGATGTGSTPGKGGSGSTANNSADPKKAAPTFPKVLVNVKTFRLGGGRVFTVRFKAKKTARFTLVMTNAKGKVVRTLNAGRKTKGKTVTFKWNGRDKRGKFVSAGTYRFRVTAVAGKAKQTVKGSVKVIRPK
jgi:FlgD Ig-like domain